LPIIPEYSSNVTPSAETPNILVNPAAMSKGWEGLEDLSQGLSRANDEVSSGIATIQDRQAKIAAYDAANKYQQAITARSIKAKELEGNAVNDYSSITGKDEDKTTDLFTGESNQLPGVRAQFLEKLDPKAREIFNHLANGTDDSYRSTLASHQATETRAYNAAVVKDTFEIAKQSIVENPNDKNIEEQIKKVREVISLHTGKADKELADKMEADLRSAGRARKVSNMVTTETVALQREMKIKYPDDPVRALDEALTKATSPEWREDAMNRGIDETAQQRIVSQLNSSLIQQNHLYKNNVDKKLSDFLVLLDNKGVDQKGRPLSSWKDSIDSFIYGKDSGLNGEDKKKFLHMANQEIDRQVKEIKSEQAEIRRDRREAEHIQVERHRAATDDRREKAEREKAAKDKKKDEVLQRIISGDIKDPIDIARTPGMDVDTMKSLGPVLKEVSSSIYIKDAYKTVDVFVKTHESDPLKQKQLLSEMHDKLHASLAGKSDPAEIKKIVDDMMTEKTSARFKDILEVVGNFFNPKPEAKAEQPKTQPKQFTESSLRADLASHGIKGQAADDYIKKAKAAGKL
jgi:hypothetical protein